MEALLLPPPIDTSKNLQAGWEEFKENFATFLEATGEDGAKPKKRLPF